MLRQEEIEYAKNRAVVQALLGKEEAVKAFDSYRSLALPFVDAANRSVDDEAKKALAREVAKGPLVARPLWEAVKKGKSKIRQRQDEAASSQRDVRKMNRLYSKMGNQLRPAREKSNGP